MRILQSWVSLPPWNRTRNGAVQMPMDSPAFLCKLAGCNIEPILKGNPATTGTFRRIFLMLIYDNDYANARLLLHRLQKWGGKKETKKSDISFDWGTTTWNVHNAKKIKNPLKPQTKKVVLSRHMETIVHEMVLKLSNIRPVRIRGDENKVV